MLHHWCNNRNCAVTFWLVYKIYMFDKTTSEDVFILEFIIGPKYLVSCTKSILLPPNTTETLPHNLFILLLKNMHTDLRTLNVKEINRL